MVGFSSSISERYTVGRGIDSGIGPRARRDRDGDLKLPVHLGENLANKQKHLKEEIQAAIDDFKKNPSLLDRQGQPMSPEAIDAMSPTDLLNQICEKKGISAQDLRLVRDAGFVDHMPDLKKTAKADSEKRQKDLQAKQKTEQEKAQREQDEKQKGLANANQGLQGIQKGGQQGTPRPSVWGPSGGGKQSSTSSDSTSNPALDQLTSTAQDRLGQSSESPRRKPSSKDGKKDQRVASAPPPEKEKPSATNQVSATPPPQETAPVTPPASPPAVDKPASAAPAPAALPAESTVPADSSAAEKPVPLAQNDTFTVRDIANAYGDNRIAELG